MKLKNIFMLMALTLGASAFVACGDDDEPTPQDQGTISEANKAVVGVYEGWTQLKTAYIPSETNPGRYANDTFTLALSDGGSLVATFQDATWGTATITGIQATDENADGLYELQGGEGSFVMNNIRTGKTETFSCKLENAVVNPKAHEMSAVISAYMEVGHGNMTFAFQTGEMPAVD